MNTKYSNHNYTISIIIISYPNISIEYIHNIKNIYTKYSNILPQTQGGRRSASWSLKTRS